jgi:hypothetical protein
MFAPITKFNEGESNTPCPSTLEVTYSSDEQLISKALRNIEPALLYQSQYTLLKLISFQNYASIDVMLLLNKRI